MISYDQEWSNDLSYFKTCWQEAAPLLLGLKKFQSLPLDVSALLLISARFYMVITSAHTELQAFPSRATWLMLSFQQSFCLFQSLSVFYSFEFPLLLMLACSTMNTTNIDLSVLISFLCYSTVPPFNQCSIPLSFMWRALQNGLR